MGSNWCGDPNFVKRSGRIEAYERPFVSKGWGWEEWIANSHLYCLKRLFVKQGKMCSWHYHNIKDETFLIVSGKIYLQYSWDDCMAEGYFIASEASWSVLEPGDVFHIPPGLRHRFTGMLDSMIHEVSTEHFDEDSIRLVKGD